MTAISGHLLWSPSSLLPFSQTAPSGVSLAVSSCPTPVRLQWGERPQKGEFASFRALVWAVTCARAPQFLSRLWRCRCKDEGSKLCRTAHSCSPVSCNSSQQQEVQEEYVSMLGRSVPWQLLSPNGTHTAVRREGGRLLSKASPVTPLTRLSFSCPPAEGNPMRDNVEKNTLYLWL